MIEEIDNILHYMKRAGLNTINTDSPAWKLIHNKKCQKNVKNPLTCQKVDNSIGFGNGQKMTVGLLVRHRTVPQLGLGLVVGESKTHKDYWIVQWCDRRYHDVGELGIDRDYLVIV